MTDPVTLAWLAGLLEGEGYFGLVPNWVGGKRYRYPRIGVNMTDRDVVERVAYFWGTQVQTLKPSGVSRKVAYRTQVSGKRAEMWMEALFPMMGARRQEQIAQTLEARRAEGGTRARRSASCRLAAANRSRRSDGTFLPNQTGTHTALVDFARA